MSNEIWSKEVEAAAKWWSDHLRSDALPSRRLTRPDEPISGMTFALMTLTTMRPNFDEDVVQAFEQALVVLIGELCDKSSWDVNRPMWGGGFRVIGIDYHPDRTLEAAAATAGIAQLGRYLPIKTTMWINPNSVTVSEGYGAGAEVIYPSVQSSTD